MGIEYIDASVEAKIGTCNMWIIYIIICWDIEIEHRKKGISNENTHACRPMMRIENYYLYCTDAPLKALKST